MDMLDELGQKDILISELLEEMRVVKGYSSILTPLTDDYMKTHNRTFFYDGDVMEYQVGTSRIVKAVVDGEVRYIRVSASALKKGLVTKAPKRKWKKGETAKAA